MLGSIILTSIAAILAFAIIAISEYFSEKRKWNNGKCTCGCEWNKFKWVTKMTNLDKSRVYYCPDCSNEISIWWPVDRKKGN